MAPALFLPNQRSARRIAVAAVIAVFSCSAFAQTKEIGGLRLQLPDSLTPTVLHSTITSLPNPSQRIAFTMALAPRDMAGLQAFADSVSDPSSPNYRKFITPKEIGDRFGASAEDRQKVVAYLESKGLHVGLVASNGLGIIADGTTAQIENLFATRIANYRGTGVDGVSTITFRSNSTALTLPSDIAKNVSSISGLETSSRPVHRTTRTFCAGQSSGVYGLKPSQGFSYYGQGRHIAISNFDGYRLSDAKIAIADFGLPIPAAGIGTNITKSVITGQRDGETYATSGEGDLDIQMVVEQAPLADIRIYDGASATTADLLGTLTKESNDNWADIITESYGWNLTAANTNSAHTLHVAMTAQGITYMAASGDSGTNYGNYPYPTYDPEVLSVGGTIATVSTDLFASDGTRVSEVGWSGSGGGWYNSAASITWNTLPTWQKGPGVPTNYNRRLSPDIAFQSADNNVSAQDQGGHIVRYTYQGTSSYYGFSGTSCSSPLFAGMLGTVEGRLYNGQTSSTRPRLGRLQNLIYSQKGRSDVYYDVTSGTNGKLPTNSTGTNNGHQGPTSNCTAGWDFVTGWGPINMEGFYKSFFGGRP